METSIGRSKAGTRERTARLTFNTAMLCICVVISSISTCRKRAVGCVLTKDRHIVATGYNGAPAGQPHCLDAGCIRSPETGQCIRCTHAEANACMRCASADTAFCTCRPCVNCLRMMLAKGVTRVYYVEHVESDTDSDEYLRQTYGPNQDDWPTRRVGGEPGGIADLLFNVAWYIGKHIGDNK